MFGVFPLTPAYGRDYKSKAEVEAAFHGGGDFQTANGSYCSVRDFQVGSLIEVRYNKLRTYHSFARKDTAIKEVTK